MCRPRSRPRHGRTTRTVGARRWRSPVDRRVVAERAIEAPSLVEESDDAETSLYEYFGVPLGVSADGGVACVQKKRAPEPRRGQSGEVPLRLRRGARACANVGSVRTRAQGRHRCRRGLRGGGVGDLPVNGRRAQSRREGICRTIPRRGVRMPLKRKRLGPLRQYIWPARVSSCGRWSDAAAHIYTGGLRSWRCGVGCNGRACVRRGHRYWPRR